MYEPVIKWCGSKRTQAKEIIEVFPTEIDCYYEPFCGSAAVLRRLLDANITCKHYICSDVNADLISLWNYIKSNSKELSKYYTKLWTELNKDNDFERKKVYFEDVRARYNKEHSPYDFLFIMRTTTNGMPRYNKKGDFNNSFHVTRNGIQPQTLEKILTEWAYVLNINDVRFIHCDFTDIKPTCKDYLYMDPPYANTKGMYFGKIDYEIFWNYLRGLRCNYSFSFDGCSGNVDNTQAVPIDVYTKHKYLCNGNSSFKRTIGKDNKAIVYESLYIKEQVA